MAFGNMRQCEADVELIVGQMRWTSSSSNDGLGQNSTCGEDCERVVGSTVIEKKENGWLALGQSILFTVCGNSVTRRISTNHGNDATGR